MKRSSLMVPGSLSLGMIVALALLSTSGFSDGQTAVISQNKQAVRSLTIVDQNGRVALSGIASAESQLFDVTVAPGGSRVFSPNTLSISAGDTVRWTWQGSGHSVTSGSPCTADSQFCSPDDMNCSAGVLSDTGTIYTHTFGQAGDYSYFCVAHCLSGMTGTIHVAEILQPTAAVSRKTHGAAGDFDVDLPLAGTPGVECRTGGGTNDYTMVVTFDATVSSSPPPLAKVTSGMGDVGSGGIPNGGTVVVNGDIVTVPLTNIANAQTINVRLNGVTVGANTGNADFSMSLLIGDSNGNGTVNASDVAQTKGRIGQALTTSNFRSDVNANGAINAGDVSIVKSHSGESVP